MAASLLDIAPPEVTAEEVDIRGTKLVLRGITNMEMATLYRRFPIFAKQVSGEERRAELLALPTLTAGQTAELDRLTISPEDNLSCNILIKPPMIAAGLGELGNEAIEAGVSKLLTKEEQSAVMGVVMRLTSPNLAGERAIALEGFPLFLIYRDPETGDIEHVWAGIAGRNGILPQTWYTLDKEGRPMKVPADPLAPGASAVEPGAGSETATPPQ